MRNNAINSLGMLGPFVVGADLGSNYTNINSAITAASATSPTYTAPINVYIKPGVYTEDLNLVPNVFLVGLGGTLGTNSASQDGNMPVRILGHHHCTMNNPSGLTFDSIQFVNNNASNALFSFTGPLGTTNCFFTFVNCKVQDGSINQNLLHYGGGIGALACTTEFFDCAFKQIGTGLVYDCVATGSFNQTITFNHCLLFCNPLTSGTTNSWTIFLNDCTFIGSGSQIINSTGGDTSNYTFTNCILSGEIINVTSTAFYNFTECEMTSFLVSGTNNVFPTVFMNDCQVTITGTLLPSEFTFPLGSMVTIENCWFTALGLSSIGGGTIQVLVNKTHPVASLTTVFFTGAYKYEVQVGFYSVGNTVTQLLEIPVDIPCSTLVNIAIVGNCTVTQPSTTSGFIQAGYYLPTGGGGTPIQNFFSTNVATAGLNAGVVSIVLSTGAINLKVNGTTGGLSYLWYATVTWMNVFENT